MQKSLKIIFLSFAALLVLSLILTVVFMGTGWGTFAIVLILGSLLAYLASNLVLAGVICFVARRSHRFWNVLGGSFLTSIPAVLIFFLFFITDWTHDLPENKGQALLFVWLLSSLAGGIAFCFFSKRRNKLEKTI